MLNSIFIGQFLCKIIRTALLPSLLNRSRKVDSVVDSIRFLTKRIWNRTLIFLNLIIGGTVKKGGENIQKWDDKQNDWEDHMIFNLKMQKCKRNIHNLIKIYPGSYLWPWMLLTFRNLMNKVLLLTLNFCSCCCCTFTVFVLPRLWTF